MQTLWKNVGGVEIVRLTEANEVQELAHLFESVAQEQGWQPGEALRRWESQSTYFALHEPDRFETDTFEPYRFEAESGGPFLGGLQLVLPKPVLPNPVLPKLVLPKRVLPNEPGRLPCHELWPEVPLCPRSAHIAILALERSSRGQNLLFWRLVVEMWRYCVGQGITTLWIEVTPRVLPLYRRLGWPLEIVGEKRVHWGEECYLCTLGIPEVAQALLQKAESSGYYREIVAQALRVTLVVPESGAQPGATQRHPLAA